MIIKVNENGLLIPPEMLNGALEVEILEEPGRVVIILDLKKDPIFELGKNPVTIEVTDASVNHDRYIYGN